MCKPEWLPHPSSEELYFRPDTGGVAFPLSLVYNLHGDEIMIFLLSWFSDFQTWTFILASFISIYHKALYRVILKDF